MVVKVWWGVKDDWIILQSINPSYTHLVCRPEEVRVHGVAWGLLRAKLRHLP